jgi:hypothetical protein
MAIEAVARKDASVAADESSKVAASRVMSEAAVANRAAVAGATIVAVVAGGAMTVVMRHANNPARRAVTVTTIGETNALARKMTVRATSAITTIVTDQNVTT